jgi:DNA-binding PadR family transcriptional regulator
VALNSTAASVLGLLDIGPPPPWRQQWEADATMSGAEVWAAIERSVGGFWRMTRSQVYAELKKLVDGDMAAESGDGRYAITPAGKVAVKDWFVDFALTDPRPDQVRSAITLTVFFEHYLPVDTLRRVVHEHRLRLERRVETLRIIDRTLQEDRSLPGSTLRRALM